MVLQNDICTVTVNIDETYTIGSMDNKHYDIVCNPWQLKHNDMYKVHSIRIDFPQKTIRVALIGGFYSFDADCAVLEENVLTVLQNTFITQINVNDASVIHCKEIGHFGCNFGIYRIKNGYIIYGEMEITMLDVHLDKKWSFLGRDIFVSVSGKEPFTLCENSIKLYDIEDNFYEIDFMGNLISGV